MVNHPIPLPIYIVGIAALLLSIIASLKYPAALHAAVASERASRAESAQHYAEAEQQLLIVTTAYPKYDDGLISLAEDSYSAGDYQVSANTLNILNGRQLDADQVNQLNTLQSNLQHATSVHGGSK